MEPRYAVIMLSRQAGTGETLAYVYGPTVKKALRQALHLVTPSMSRAFKLEYRRLYDGIPWVSVIGSSLVLVPVEDLYFWKPVSVRAPAARLVVEKNA